MTQSVLWLGKISVENDFQNGGLSNLSDKSVISLIREKLKLEGENQEPHVGHVRCGTPMRLQVTALGRPLHI